jgi:signal transduction histidine kinase
VAAAVIAGLTAAPPSVAQTPARRVLIIHGGPEQFPGNSGFDAAIRQSLFSRPTLPVEAHSEYLENEEFADTAGEALSASIRIKRRNRPIDLVIANTAPTLQFVLRQRDDLFSGIPIVFAAAVVPPAVLQGKVPGATGIVREGSQVETIDVALKIHPATKRVHVIAYAPVVPGFQARVQATLARFSARVAVTYSEEPTLPELLTTIKALPADTLLFYVRYSPVVRGRIIFPDEMLPEIVQAAPVPIYCSLDSYLGKGVVGGVMRNGHLTGVRLGELAVKVLEGATPESIPIEPAQIRTMFDWRALQRWGIDESRLPPGSEIRFRAPTVWELYGSYIVGAIVVVSAQLLLIAGLLQSRARLRRADNVIRAREASLRVSYDRIRQMAGRLINAQEAARAEIARDLHDDVCQRLTSVSIGVGGLKNATGSLEDPNMQEGIDELDRETRDAFESIRRLSHDLHPATLRLLGLAPALRSHCQEIAKRHGVQVEFSGSDGIGTLDPDVAVCFFRIAQESLRNSVVHGGAKQMTVRLGRERDELDLTVVDNGRGFDVAAARNNGRGLGLVTMEERVNLVGGHMSIASVPGQGTTVRVRGPLHPHPLH